MTTATEYLKLLKSGKIGKLTQPELMQTRSRTRLRAEILFARHSVKRLLLAVLDQTYSEDDTTLEIERSVVEEFFAEQRNLQTKWSGDLPYLRTTSLQMEYSMSCSEETPTRTRPDQASNTPD